MTRAGIGYTAECEIAQHHTGRRHGEEAPQMVPLSVFAIGEEPRRSPRISAATPGRWPVCCSKYVIEQRNRENTDAGVCRAFENADHEGARVRQKTHSKGSLIIDPN